MTKYHQPCINPECNSSDAMAIYDDGTAYCFSCNKHFSQKKMGISPKNLVVEKEPQQSRENINDILTYPIKGIADRGIKKDICEFYKVRSEIGEDGDVTSHYYQYSKASFKKRFLPKTFYWVGKIENLFGQDLFNEGGKRLIITEGEIDTLSVAMTLKAHYDKIYPVVSLPSANSDKIVIAQRDWIRSFDEVILFLDADTPGQEAATRLAKIIGYDKCKVPKYPKDCKDPNDILIKYGTDQINRCIWDAIEYSPVGILSKDALWAALAEYNNIESVPYPECLKGLNTKLKGMRLGEMTLFTSGTGSGKSTMMREIILDLLEKTDARIGIISLEEHPAETVRKLSGMAIERNPAKEEISLEDLRVGFDQVFKDDRVLVLDHQGSAKDDKILDKLEYMAVVGCKYIIVDHITILVSEGAEGFTGNEAIDLMMNRLLSLIKKHNIWIGLVSHLRKTNSGKSFEEGELPNMDDIKGSGSIKQISFDIVAFARDMSSKLEDKRNEIKIRVLKCRYTGLTGDVPGAQYIYNTGRLCSLEDIPIEEMF